MLSNKDVGRNQGLENHRRNIRRRYEVFGKNFAPYLTGVSFVG